jgi:hypothetical protein
MALWALCVALWALCVALWALPWLCLGWEIWGSLGFWVSLFAPLSSSHILCSSLRSRIYDRRYAPPCWLLSIYMLSCCRYPAKKTIAHITLRYIFTPDCLAPICSMLSHCYLTPLTMFAARTWCACSVATLLIWLSHVCSLRSHVFVTRCAR